ncbi:unnamed protein product [Schistosoma mattheei]|uniref:Uncharacterized protein n=1 Tax=Schistosoma mattheei TaxID=31246 RepID=A0A183PV61_9TREM|nr:unnamed protein product [Schistosoma mattheei]
MEDVRTRRGADIATDHHQPVDAKMKLKLKKHWTTGQTALHSFYTAFIRRTGKLNEFEITLGNRSQEETTMEDNWKGIRGALISACQEILGRKKHHHKEWISFGVLDKIHEGKNNKTVIINNRTRTQNVREKVEHTKANKQMKEGVRADEQKHVEELVKTV